MVNKKLTELDIHWPDLRLIQQRQRKETLREVYVAGEQYIFKRFIIKKGTLIFPRPWVSERTALVRAHGLPVPEYVATHEGMGGNGCREYVLQRTLIPGLGIKALDDDCVEAMAELLARIHLRGIVTQDATLNNFLRAPDGTLFFIDFGKASVYRRKMFYEIGSEMARFVHGTLNYDETLWQLFIRRYYEKRAIDAFSKSIELFFYRFCKHNRRRRHSIPQ